MQWQREAKVKRLYHGGEGQEYGGVTYFTSDKEFAKQFGKVYLYEVDLKNPYVFDGGAYKYEDGTEALDDDGEEISIGWIECHPEIIEDMERRGYDGAIEEGDDFVVAFSSDQFKLLGDANKIKEK